MVQACERNRAVRQGIIAIAALDITSRLTHDRTRHGGTDPRTHYQFALQEYSLAIRAMQKETRKGELDLATTLITCLVIICFETFHGSRDNALNQISTGLLMISQSAKKETSHSTRLVEGLPSSLLANIDDELIRAFVRLDLQAMSFATNLQGGLPRPAFRKGSPLTSLRDMPARFQSLTEARHYLELLEVHCVGICSRGMKKLLSRKDPTYHDVPPPENEGIDWYLDATRRWHEAFQRILTYARTEEGKKDFLVASMLELH
jgi:hypothetical protein